MIENFDDLRDAIRADLQKAADEENERANAVMKARMEAVFARWESQESDLCDVLSKATGLNIWGFTIRRNYNGTNVDYSIDLAYGGKHDTAD